jgi:anti-sigma regulatory factor (Ser/Thr protein kinase)
MPDGAMALTLKAVPENIREARQAVSTAACRCGADVEGVALATSEAVTNIIRNGDGARAKETPAEFRLRAEREGDELVVTVSGGEGGFSPNSDISGVGSALALIASLATSIGFSPSGPGLGLTMRFPCTT